MTREERNNWLLGIEIPIRVIPAGSLRTGEDRGEAAAASVDPADHRPLGESVIDPSHPIFNAEAHVTGMHNETLHHKDENGVSHHLVVSSANRAALDAHLESASVWLLATPSVPPSGPQPVYLAKVVAQAVEEVTGSSVVDHLAAPRDEEHVHYRDLLGPAIEAVRNSAVAILDGELRELESAGVIDFEDRDALDAGWLIDLFLRAKAEDASSGTWADHDWRHRAWLGANPESVLTRFGPVDLGQDLSFSFRDVNSIKQGACKSWETPLDGQYPPWPTSLPSITETINISSGRAKVSINYFDSVGTAISAQYECADQSLHSASWRWEKGRHGPYVMHNPGRDVIWRVVLTALTRCGAIVSGTINGTA